MRVHVEHTCTVWAWNVVHITTFIVMPETKLCWEVFTLAAWGLWKVRNAKLFDNIALSVTAWKIGLKSELQKLAYRSTNGKFTAKLTSTTGTSLLI